MAKSPVVGCCPTSRGKRRGARKPPRFKRNRLRASRLSGRDVGQAGRRAHRDGAHRKRGPQTSGSLSATLGDVGSRTSKLWLGLRLLRSRTRVVLRLLRSGPGPLLGVHHDSDAPCRRDVHALAPGAARLTLESRRVLAAARILVRHRRMDPAGILVVRRSQRDRPHDPVALQSN